MIHAFLVHVKTGAHATVQYSCCIPAAVHADGLVVTVPVCTLYTTWLIFLVNGFSFFLFLVVISEANVSCKRVFELKFI